MDKVFDFIVCGGGASGCVVAARLAQCPGVKVLLIEAGSNCEDLEDSQMAGGWNSLFGGSTDWGFESPPSAALDDRRLQLHRGKFIGGSTGLNGTLCIRGARADYDNWGIEGWSGDDFFQYMMKSEKFHPKPWFDADTQGHGDSGPLHTEPRELAPISELILQSFQSEGLPYDADIFTHGRNPQGSGHITRTHWQGYRSTSASFITMVRDGNQLEVVTNTVVDRVVLEQSPDGLRAVAVDVINSDSSRSRFKATREVILSAGSYCSPAILLRSGLGARADLDQLGIPCQIDLVGVGKNLLDHLIVFMFYETDKEGLTIDHLIHRKEAYSEALKLWRDHKSGFLASSPFGVGAYARLDERLKQDPQWTGAAREAGKDPMGLTADQPNIEFFTTECYGGLKRFAHLPEGKSVFGIVAELFSPRSQGTVTITSADATALPVVDHNYLAEPLDVLVLSEACSFANEIITKGKGTSAIVKGSWPEESLHHTYTSREAWTQYVRENATSGSSHFAFLFFPCFPFAQF
ncbi:CAZyme family AA3 [Trichoderma aggressivum f. europaeum]|uniref:CAZyme family AA3 n=1 Tax=Trichoderma aggressivum f. europaeum TaxID=173218 RepID=A0AAE1IYY1_9HYPO|nr:CAZyme family AA3 [Trichoderma aggressivum f. europaeum]